MPAQGGAFLRSKKRELDLAYSAIAQDLEVSWWGDLEPLWAISSRFVRTWWAAWWAWAFNRL